MTASPPDLNEATPSSGKLTSEGYHRGLNKRQIQMISIGGAIGSGLFLGAGARLEAVGPALALIYLVCGFFAFMMLRAMGELVMYRPTSGSFVSYAQEFLGPKASYVAGSMAFLNWAMSGIGDITAVALYMRFWGPMHSVPQWIFALLALVLITSMNLVGVRWFGEMEFWFSLIKVSSLIIFLIVGAAVLGLRIPVEHQTTGLHLITENGGFFPHGVMPTLVLVQGVIFAYAGIELIGTAAGECEDVKTILPKAINSVMWRIALFYIGTITLLVLLLPWSRYKAGVSPFVTFFSSLGVSGIGSFMNVVVMTAALSSLNSGLYSTGRILRALALDGSAPRYLTKMNKRAVPAAAIFTTVAVYIVGVFMNYLLPSEIFEIVISLSSIGILGTWCFIVLSQIKLRQAINAGKIPPTSFPMPGAPFTSWITLAFFIAVLLLMAFNYPEGTFSFCSIPIIAGLLTIGWKFFRKVPPHEAVPQTAYSIKLTEDLIDAPEAEKSSSNKNL